MKNANVKGFDKDRKQSSSSQFKSQDRGEKDAKDGSQYTIPSKPKCFGCQGLVHMKKECPTYLKSIGKSKALTTTLSDTEPEIKSNDSDDEGILNAFTATIDLFAKNNLQAHRIVTSSKVFLENECRTHRD